MTIPPITGRRVAVLVAAAVIIAVILIVVLSGLHSGGSKQSASDASLQRTGEQAGARLNHPKLTLPIPDQSFNSFQAWYYDVKAAVSSIDKHIPRGEYVEAQMFDKDAFPPQFLQVFPTGDSFLVLDSPTANKVFQTHQPAFTTITISGHAFRAYVAPLTVPANLKPSNVGGYYAVLKLQS